MNDIKIIIEAASENTVATAVKKIGNIKAGGATKTINGAVRKNGDIEDLLVPIKSNLYSLHYSSVNQSDKKRIRLQAEAMQNLEALLTDAFNNKIYIKVNSAYRTREDQERIKIDSARTGIPAATPGTSNHGFGLAVDLGNVNGVRINPIKTPKEWKWIQENKSKYGFDNINNNNESHHYNFIK
jgi:LAS superfamily LD-carboxypeptidase LdcB